MIIKDRVCFEKAWDFLIKSNEMLRTVFRWEKLAELTQVVLKTYVINLQYMEREIPVVTLFTYPTIRSLELYITREQGDEEDDPGLIDEGKDLMQLTLKNWTIMINMKGACSWVSSKK